MQMMRECGASSILHPSPAHCYALRLCLYSVIHSIDAFSPSCLQAFLLSHPHCTPLNPISSCALWWCLAPCIASLPHKIANQKLCGVYFGVNIARVLLPDEEKKKV